MAMFCYWCIKRKGFAFMDPYRRGPGPQDRSYSLPAEIFRSDCTVLPHLDYLAIHHIVKITIAKQSVVVSLSS